MVWYLAFKIILGMLWLMYVNPRLDFAQRTLAVQCRSHWVILPTRMQQNSELSHAQNYNGSNTSNPSVQNTKPKGAH